MTRLDWRQLDASARVAAIQRPAARADATLSDNVRTIIEDVRAGGWDALCRIAETIDDDAPRCLGVAEAAVRAYKALSPDEIAAMELAAENIAAFHRTARPETVALETRPGLMVRKVWRPIDRVGLYVPGGNAPLFSTLMMLAIPARVAGVVEIAVVTPPRSDGGLDPVISLAAKFCGIDTIWTVGGAQAIAALAVGAGDIPKVDKICGPGNAWVGEAKRQISAMPGGPAIDLPAGPSELFVIADAKADPARVAADLLSQAEHDADAQVLLASDSGGLIDSVEREIAVQLNGLPRRSVAEAALGSARLIATEDLAQAADVANLYAPEHLALAVVDPESLLPVIRNAGAVFAGGASAESFGDYLAGSSHVLPTDGAARAWSGITTQSFMKAMTVQTMSNEAAAALAGPTAALARLEGLEAHARAAEMRAEKVPA